MSPITGKRGIKIISHSVHSSEVKIKEATDAGSVSICAPQPVCSKISGNAY